RDAWLATQLATLTAADRDLLARASEVMSRLATE
ncbi:MAG: hypothetical protein JWN20_772, partial [Jatrophihabitantaceae bacterium]|nr:hypothetical protein [Jatrophihabitantaceae bacterium]